MKTVSYALGDNKVTQENAVLCAQLQQGDKTVEQTLLLQNKGLIRTLARQEYRRYPYLTLEQEDLEMTGALALLQAASCYHKDRGSSFSAWAWMYMRRAVRREIVACGTWIRFPEQTHYAYHRTWQQQTTASPAALHVTTNGQESEARDVAYLRLWMTVESLDKTVSLQNKTPLWDTVIDPEPTPEEIIESACHVQSLLSCLNSREKDVITLRYGLDTGNTHTLAEVGETLSVSRERVRQIEKRALKKMRAELQKETCNSVQSSV